MSEITIQEGNKLIAEFMGGKFSHSFDPDYITFKPVKFGGMAGDYSCSLIECYFHSSWDWLMPVVEKIQSIDITPPPNYEGYRIEIVVQGYVKITGRNFPTIFTNVSIEGSLINAIWKAVIKFIQWYNTQTLIK